MGASSARAARNPRRGAANRDRHRGVGPVLPAQGHQTMRNAILAASALLAFAVAGAPAFAKDEMMKKDQMGKETMSHDSMKADAMKKDAMKGDAMKGDAMK